MARRALAASLVIVASAATAYADSNDLVMSRLAQVVDQGGTPSGVIPQNVEFRALASELGVALAPRLLAPSDTLGFGGFQFAVDFGFTSITSDASYWRVLRSSTAPTNMSASHGVDLLPTVGLFARKGLWFLPSMELGGGAVHLMDSRMWTGQVYAKLALHEGYHQLPIPSVAVRAALSRLMGNGELDLTIASFDLSASKHFGIGGTWSVDPYLGYNLLVIVPRSEVIDATPGTDPLAMGAEGDRANNFVFRDQDDIHRHRAFLGAKLQYYVFSVVLEANLAFAGKSVDDRAGTDLACTVDANTESCDSKDRAKSQQTYTISAGLDF